MALLAGLALLPVVGIGELLTFAHQQGAFLPGADDLIVDKIINLIVGPLFTVLLLASIWLAARWFDRRPFARFGGPDGGRWWVDFAFGLGVGAFLQAVLFTIESRAGWIEIESTHWAISPQLPFAFGIGFSVVKALCVGTAEEFLSRGYQLVNLTEGLTGRGGLDRKRAGLVAALVTSAVFGLLHITNENSTWRSTTGLVANGMLLATGPLLTGKLAIPIGLHMGWNFMQGSVLGFPVSGDKESASWLAIRQGGPELWTGGDFGPEGGLLSVVVTLVGIVLVAGWVRLWRRGRTAESSPHANNH